MIAYKLDKAELSSWQILSWKDTGMFELLCLRWHYLIPDTQYFPVRVIQATYLQLFYLSFSIIGQSPTIYQVRLCKNVGSKTGLTSCTGQT